ncbi:MAG: branched-chain amino acid ABC transporter permease, partial [Thermoleophilia bacterium]|nr:branched-chain amino acid ABC transporter permease [Thermoleophilia bacterium]
VHVMSGMDHGIPGVHLSIWLIFPIAAVVTALFGVLLGAPTLRLRGDYLAIVTLGFGEIIPSVFRNGDDILGHNVTNGTAGISGLDAPSMGGPAVDNSMGLGWGTWGPLNLSPWYYLALLLCGICFYVARTMQWSKLGRAWMAIREDETAASAMGIHCVNAKLWAYGIGASLGGLAGVYHGARIGSIFPSSFMFYISISVLCMVIVGGMGNVWGAVVGAFVIEGLNFWLLPSLTKWGNAIGLGIDFSSWNMLIFGVLLVVMMLYRPQGFVPSRSRKLVFADDDGVQGGELDSDEHGFPGGMHGPDGDQGHGMHVPLAVGAPHASGHVTGDLVPESRQHVAQPAHETPDTGRPETDTPTSRPASLPRFGRYAPGSNPFRRPIEPGGAPA